jgi:hypothetical protein
VAKLNPSAKVVPLNCMADFDMAIARVQDLRLIEHGYTRIVVDSFTEITEYLPTWMGLGFPLQKQHYGQIQNKAMSLVLALLQAPLPSIILCRSSVKEMGDVSKVVPSSLGKSAENLPAKCILTGETRFDDEKGWIIDTTPSPYVQRSGLPWVPQIFQGEADEFLHLVEDLEAGPQQVDTSTLSEPLPPPPPPEPKRNAREKVRPVDVAKIPPPPPHTALPPPAPEPDPEWVSLLVTFGESLPKETTAADRKTLVTEWENLAAKDLAATKQALREYLAEPAITRGAPVPDPETQPKEYTEAFGQACAEQQAENLAAKPAVSQAAADFVEDVSPALAKAEDITGLLDLCREYKVQTDALWRYAVSKGGAPAGAKCPNWHQLGAAFVVSATLNLTNPEKRRAFVPWVHKTHGKA